jgi:hypothetical protein
MGGLTRRQRRGQTPPKGWVSFQFPNLFQDRRRVGAVLDSLGQVSPGNPATAIDEQVRRDGDVGFVRSAAFVNQPVVCKDFSIDVGEDWKWQIAFFYHPRRFLRSIDADSQQAAAAALQFLRHFPEPNELRNAHPSPKAAIEDKKHGTGGVCIAEFDRVSVLIRQREVRRRGHRGEARRFGHGGESVKAVCEEGEEKRVKDRDPTNPFSAVPRCRHPANDHP